MLLALAVIFCRPLVSGMILEAETFLSADNSVVTASNGHKLFIICLIS